MRINFETVINGVDGKPLPEQIDVLQCPNCGFRNGVQKEFGKLTLKTMALTVLQAIFRDEPDLNATEKARRGLMAIRIYANPKNIDLEIKEIELIQRLIGKFYGPIQIVRANEILEKKEVEPTGVKPKGKVKSDI